MLRNEFANRLAIFNDEVRKRGAHVPPHEPPAPIEGV